MMRYDYDQIKQKFTDFIEAWQNKKITHLEEFVCKDVHAYLSVINTEQPVGLETAGVKSETDGAQHTIFGIRDFILDTPVADNTEVHICNYVCRLHEDLAQQAAEVACKAINRDGRYFQYIAIFCNTWRKKTGKWLMEEIHLDIKHEGGPLVDEFRKVWYFEEPLAVLTKSVHLPCIFPELDSPYYKIRETEDILTEVEKVMDCFYQFNYGIDWIIFKDVKKTLHENFKNKREFIAQTKFARQSYRYSSHAYTCRAVEIKGDFAEAIVETWIPAHQVKRIAFCQNKGPWQILSIGEE